MRFRVSASYAKDIKQILFFSYRDNTQKSVELLDYFVLKLKYDKIHFDMIGSWVTQNIMNEWVSDLLFRTKEIRSVIESLDYITTELKFKPLFWRRVSLGWARNESLSSLMWFCSESQFEDCCELLSVMCSYTSIFKDGFTFYGGSFLFKLIWQISDETFTKIINNIRTHNVKFNLVPTTSNAAYRDYLQRIMINDRPVIMPHPFVLARWTDLLSAFRAPEDSLGKILKCFPGQCSNCQEKFKFRN